MDTLPVSVLIPAYDREHHVGHAVRSALGQRPRPPAEVVVIDDASRDGTAAVAEAAGARVLRLPVNTGRGGARNAGLHAVTSDWVALLDSDDLWQPDHLDRLWPHRHGHVLVAASARSGTRDRVFGNTGRTPLVVDSPAQLFWPENPVVTSSALLARRALLDVGFSERVLAQDLETWVRLLSVGTVLVLPEIHVTYGEHVLQASADREGSHRAVREILEACRLEPWWSPGLRDRVLNLQDTELAVKAWRRGEWRRVARLALRVTGRPQAAWSLVHLAAWRRTVRPGARRGRRTLPSAGL